MAVFRGKNETQFSIYQQYFSWRKWQQPGDICNFAPTQLNKASVSVSEREDFEEKYL
jgi:hypothetical protein